MADIRRVQGHGTGPRTIHREPMAESSCLGERGSSGSSEKKINAVYSNPKTRETIGTSPLRESEISDGDIHPVVSIPVVACRTASPRLAYLTQARGRIEN